MPDIRRLFVEKKPEFAVEAEKLRHDLREQLGITGLEGVRLAARYDVEGLSAAHLEAARWTVFAEPPVDAVFDEELPVGPEETALAVEYLPGQYDQRADSAAQCLQLLSHGARPAVAGAHVFVFRGALAPGDMDRIRGFLINPVDSREASWHKPATLTPVLPEPAAVAVLDGFNEGGPSFLEELHARMGLAMTLADLEHTRTYFRGEGRNPTETELRLLDTYWSDHCRHTTFLTRVTDVAVEDGPMARPIRRAYGAYRDLRAEVFGEELADRPECLMDIALLPARALRRAGKLDDQELTSEINACSVVVDVDNTAAPGGHEPWLLMFKNETHNHPTEIEPFGGAATCLGGAIRDPLSGRSYVYQSMRVTGSGDPRVPMDATLPGKLPQRKITQEAAQGFASYGNQIGLCTGQVTEYYDPGFVAKRMEIGAVVGAVPQAQVRREEPAPGDVIILVGGRTGRDGIGGATGSSKSHTEDSIDTCGAEVQKGDPPMERKLQRLFRSPAFCRLVKKCNDFGAGGVGVAIGELAPGLVIDLDVIPRKYEGLNGTELAIAESQERMAVAVAAEDAPEVLRLASLENLEATLVARVTEEPRLRMTWRGRTIADLSREFLDTNGAAQFTSVRIESPAAATPFAAPPVAPEDLERRWLEGLADLNTCSQRGLGEKFDCTIGAGTVLAPFGGRLRRTPGEAMVAKFPVQDGETLSASAMSHGYFPALSRWSPFHGAVWAHVQAAARLAVVGADPRKLRFTLQEYFGKPAGDPVRWGRPFAALLGALHAEMALGAPAIGGKDSMSGTFKDLDVPPTLVAFAVDVVRADQVTSPEFKGPGHAVVLIDLLRTEEALPDWEVLDKTYAHAARLVREGRVLAARTVGMDGLAPALSIMAFGNGVGLELECREPSHWFAPRPGALVLELDGDLEELLDGLAWTRLGTTRAEPVIRTKGMVLPLDRAMAAWEAPLEPIFPTRLEGAAPALPPFQPRVLHAPRGPALGLARPRVVLTVFPGTNCEYDTAQVFERAGAVAETVVFRNLDARAVEESLDAMAEAIARAQILMIPGGFSAGDEPEGSGKFIAAAYRNPRVKDAVHELLGKRDGLVLGICNGFQALIKLGLVPFGEIRDLDPRSPTLTFNSLRYASRFARTRVVANGSPWLSRLQPGAVHTVAIAHGEGRIVGPADVLEDLLARGQVATQYVDDRGEPTLDLEFNPNGSSLAIEGLTSPDGRVFGKMAHPERYTPHVWYNVPGDKDMEIFRAGVDYFR
ncbi:phosphoribosylformylglycinamidine synthase [Geothrix sp. 21YS21S-2]|uniref:phosphoribosylformylglycinamidine synthase n=1 Tax=Geothrix sp. 21YS21S-2 TaxID=3068893 RepID=UPI0027BAD27E|nr:phosphoribosylformylglycinamidine synthase [Geothrix sp. 21YS21S-2]